MSEQPETTDSPTEPAGGPTEPQPLEEVLGGEPGADAPESDSEPTPDAPDFDAIHAATEAHDSAVAEAHGNLKTRMESAYAEMKVALDKARDIWENATKDARAAMPLVREAEKVADDVNTDPTRAR
jgi:hypothetical protein